MNPFDVLVHDAMIPLLNAIYGVTQSYGLAIIGFTLLIKALLFPLTARQFKNMRAMQKLQPKLQELQAKYKNDPQELQKQMMGFYQENKVNPLGSCLPTLIQLPFLIGLYWALMDKGFQEGLRGKSFLFIQDLARIGVFDPKAANLLAGVHWDSLALVLFFGASTFVLQKMMTTNPDDPMQKQMLMMMPVMMTVMFIFFPLPAGILLYIAVSNIITLGQNFLLLRQHPPTAPVANTTVIDTSAKPAEPPAPAPKKQRSEARKKGK